MADFQTIVLVGAMAKAIADRDLPERSEAERLQVAAIIAAKLLTLGAHAVEGALRVYVGAGRSEVLLPMPSGSTLH